MYNQSFLDEIVKQSMTRLPIITCQLFYSEVFAVNLEEINIQNLTDL